MRKPLAAAQESTREESLVHIILVAVLAVTLVVLLVLGRGMVMDGLVHGTTVAPASQPLPSAASPASAGPAVAGAGAAHS